MKMNYFECLVEGACPHVGSLSRPFSLVPIISTKNGNTVAAHVMDFQVIFPSELLLDISI